jgi:hypothetical protein
LLTIVLAIPAADFFRRRRLFREGWKAGPSVPVHREGRLRRGCIHFVFLKRNGHIVNPSEPDFSGSDGLTPRDGDYVSSIMIIRT